MADNQVADLPGLAPDDEPDTYETEDPKPEEDSDKFPVAMETWQLAAENDPECEETPAEKFHRLQLEFNSLKQEIYDLEQDQARGGSADSADWADITSVSMLKHQLSACRVSPLLMTDTADPALPCPESVERLVSSRQQELVYTLRARTAVAESGQDYSGQLCDLEDKLTQLEREVGPAPATTLRLGLSDRPALLPAVQQLQSQLDQLQPAAVKRCEPLLQLLHQKMNQLEDMRASLDAINKGSQLEQLHGLVGAADDSDGQVDMVVKRLADLSTLHNQAMSFGELLTMVEESQQTVDGRLTSCEKQLERMRENCYQQLSQLNNRLSTARQTAARV